MVRYLRTKEKFKNNLVTHDYTFPVLNGTATVQYVRVKIFKSWMPVRYGKLYRTNPRIPYRAVQVP